MTSVFFATLVEFILNRALQESGKKEQAVAILADKVIAFQVQGLAALYLFAHNQVISIQSVCPETVDVEVSGGLFTLLRLLINGDAALLDSSELKITGDRALIRRWIEECSVPSFDWEELLAKHLGDVPAHQVGRFFRQGQSWSKENLTRLEQNSSEYLQEELRLLPSRGEYLFLKTEIEALATRLQQLEQRVENL